MDQEGNLPADGARLQGLERDIGEMKGLMGRIVDAIQKIALLDERQQAQSAATGRILEAVEDLRERQHRAELDRAAQGDLVTRISNLEQVTRDQHIEREKDKARFNTIVWTLRGLWAVAGSGALLWVAQLTNLIRSTPQ